MSLKFSWTCFCIEIFIEERQRFLKVISIEKVKTNRFVPILNIISIVNILI